MQLNSYGDLKNQILNIIGYPDPDLIEALPSFIQQAELEILRVLRLPIFETMVSLPFCDSPTNSALTIPNDFVQAKSFFFNKTGAPITYLPDMNTWLRKKASIDTTVEGSGYYVTQIGKNFLIYPECPLMNEEEDPNDTIKLVYYRTPTMFKNDSDYTDTLAVAPDLLLNLSLKNAYIFLNNNEASAIYNGLAQNGFQQLEYMNKLGTRRPVGACVPRRRFSR